MDNPEAPPGIESKAEEEISRHRKLVERIAQFDEPPENLDFTISGKDCEYKVHSSVICSRSRFFDRAVKGRFVESTSKRIHLPEEDADTLELLISILYGFESSYSAELWPEAHADIKILLDGIDQSTQRIIPPEASTLAIEGALDTPKKNTGLRLLRLYALVDRFDIFWLQEWAKEMVLLWVKTNPRSDSFVEVIRAVYRCETGNYSEFVDEIFALVLDNVDILIENDEFYEVVAENGELGAELLRHVLSTNKIVHSALDMNSSLTELQSIGGEKLVYETAKLQLKIHHSLAEFPGLARGST
ncbi:BTB/POZ domain-containing protein [Histoplasma capsulatum G186AR]|uniref:BTB/POZ domain-containing protein n=1 Tax=Ajellomyces capsulatus TaxID=5037 RepID=A0A8H7YFY0_AJECA|nr:BTB/POZ domain-containing protein [Histoplasma capsulatum]QSS73257.1 BTB/POZ domain-containing protein [Histoplasma capsulatum G186AR]